MGEKKQVQRDSKTDGPVSLADLVNRSGYPLQVALAHLVAKNTSAHHWRVMYEEHAWWNRNDGSDGFVDLVLEHTARVVVMVVECKRVLGKQWTFVPRAGQTGSRRVARALVVERTGDDRPAKVAWRDTHPAPSSPEAMFCVIPKDGADSNLEKVASELVSATEGVEREEADAYLGRIGHHSIRLYLPVIVTTAELHVAAFDAANVSLIDGTVPAGKTTLERVDLVRFTKQLSVRASSDADTAPGSESDSLARSKERTVFVVNAQAFDSFLRGFLMPRPEGLS